MLVFGAEKAPLLVLHGTQTTVVTDINQHCNHSAAAVKQWMERCSLLPYPLRATRVGKQALSSWYPGGLVVTGPSYFCNHGRTVD